MKLFLFSIIFAFNISVFPNISFASCSGPSDEVVSLEPVQYERFTYHPETNEFEGDFWDEVATTQAGLQGFLRPAGEAARKGFIVVQRAIKQELEEQDEDGGDCSECLEGLRLIWQGPDPTWQENEKIRLQWRAVKNMQTTIRDFFLLIRKHPNAVIIREEEREINGVLHTICFPQASQGYMGACCSDDPVLVLHNRLLHGSPPLKDFFVESVAKHHEGNGGEEDKELYKAAFYFNERLVKEVSNFQAEIRKMQSSQSCVIL